MHRKPSRMPPSCPQPPSPKRRRRTPPCPRASTPTPPPRRLRMSRIRTNNCFSISFSDIHKNSRVFFQKKLFFSKKSFFQVLKQLFYYLTGMQLCNPNAWFVIALPIFYLGFYLCFRFCKNENIALILTCLVVLAYTIIGTRTNHNNFWMRGEWWYNSAHFFPLGIPPPIS